MNQLRYVVRSPLLGDIAAFRFTTDLILYWEVIFGADPVAAAHWYIVETSWTTKETRVYVHNDEVRICE